MPLQGCSIFQFFLKYPTFSYHFVASLSSMARILVAMKILKKAKESTTFSTLVGHLSCVYSFTFSKIGLAYKGHVTMTALERLFTSMNPVMKLKTDLALELLFTFRTSERLFAGVSPQVLLKSCFVSIFLITVQAFVKLDFTSVSSFMFT